MRVSIIKLAFRASLQMTVMLTSTGISANDYMEYEDVDSEQVTYEKKVHNNEHRAYQDPYFHNDSYQNEKITQETVAAH